MPVFSKDQRFVLFPHVPKTGGTTVERLFHRSGWKMHLRDGRTGAGSMNRVRRCSPQHMHAALLREIVDLSKIEFSFMIVREPMARFRSEYAMRQKDPSKTDRASVDAWADRAFARYAENPFHLDNHLRPQHDFLLPDTQVFRLEDGLAQAMTNLSRDHGLDLLPDIGHQHRSADRTGIESKDVELSPELEARVREVYAIDFEAFGYTAA